MSNSNEQIPPVSNQEMSAGEQKVLEYVERVKEGESLNRILDRLPQGFKSGIVEALLADTEALPKETRDRLEELGYTTDQSSQQEVSDDRSLTKDAVPAAKGDVLESAESKKSYELLPVEEREKLSGWQASFELAKVAHNEGVDLTALSREEYANYAVEKGLAIDDDQLRASVWQRTTISAEENILKAREIRSSISEVQNNSFHRFAEETKRRAESDDRYIGEGVRVRQGTKDSNSWLFFGINESLPENSPETHKGYLTFKELNSFSPDRLTAFFEVLQRAGYNGDVKVFQDLESQAVRLNDQIVMHGASPEDVDLANDLAREFFGTELAAVEKGKDEVVDGKNKSYSQLLAADIKRRIQERTGKNGG